MRVFSVTLLSFLATIFTGAGLLLGLPGDFAERAKWITILTPVIWTAFMFYAYWDKKAWRTTAVLSGICFTGVAVIIFVPTPA